MGRPPTGAAWVMSWSPGRSGWRLGGWCSGAWKPIWRLSLHPGPDERGDQPGEARRRAQLALHVWVRRPSALQRRHVLDLFLWDAAPDEDLDRRQPGRGRAPVTRGAGGGRRELAAQVPAPDLRADRRRGEGGA